MLEIVVPSTEIYDEVHDEFIEIKEQTLRLEHSLVSLSKWESKWHKSFISKEGKTAEETVDYIRCMTLTQNVDPKTYLCLTQENIEAVNAYIDNPMTATTINRNDGRKPNRERITSELIYYWMISLGIPVEFQKWHLNRLLTLIEVCSIKNSPPKKMSKDEIMSRNRALNAARRKKFNTKG